MLVSSNTECFSKSYSKGAFSAELTKAQLLYQKSLESRFIAPEVIDTDESSGVIRYEMLHWSGSLMDVVAEADRSRDSILELLSDVGASLAEIHTIDTPSEAVQFSRAPLFRDALLKRGFETPTVRAGVLQHGDFGFTNIFLSHESQVVVIDPSPNHYISTHPLNVDDAELDLSVLMAHLIGRAAHPRALGRTMTFGRSMVDAVLDGYQIDGRAIDRDRLRTYTLAGVDAVRAYKSVGSQAHRRAILKPLSTVLARNIA